MENTDVRVLILDKKWQVLLVLERGGEKEVGGKAFFKPSKWGMPGGRGELGDRDEVDTGRRETEEETGLQVAINEKIRAERQEDGYSKVAFPADMLGGKIKINPEEIRDCRWFPVSVLWDEKFNMYGLHRKMAQELLGKLRR